MGDSSVQLRVAGQVYRVVTSASADELGRLASKVEETLEAIVPEGRPKGPHAIVLAAIALAHELEEEQRARRELEERYKATLESFVARIDSALGAAQHTEEAEPSAGFMFDLSPEPAEVPVFTKRTGQRQFER